MKEKKTIKVQLQELYYFWCVLLCAIAAYFMPYIMDYYCYHSGSFLSFYDMHLAGNIAYMSVAMLLTALLILVLYGVIGRIDISLGIVLTFMCVLSYASYLKLQVRDEMVNYQDLAITEAGNMIQNAIKFDNSFYFYLMIGFMIVMVALGILIEVFCGPLKRTRYSKKLRLIVRGCVGGVALVGIIFGIPKILSATVDLSTLVHGTAGNEKNSCVLYSFIKTDLFDFSKADVDQAVMELREHSSEFINEPGTILMKADDGRLQETDKRPNVIVIMNESWWNVESLLMDTGMECDVDPMSVWEDLQDTGCESGDVAVNIFAGGTISSETEFLMGINVNYFSSNVGISRYLADREKNPSIVQYFNEQDYETFAIHPYLSTFYERDKVYQNYGFGHAVFLDDMKYTKKADCYVSDESLVNQIIYEYEEIRERSKAPVFSFDVSVQGHAEYLSKGETVDPSYEYPIQIDYAKTSLSKEQYGLATRTINNFYQACLAYQQLRDYFAAVDEPTVIMMYGDHCPAITPVLEELLGYNHVTDSFDAKYDMYTTPVLLWKNYEVAHENGASEDEGRVNGDNVQYLSVKLCEYAGLPDCEMMKMIRYVNSEIKTNSISFMINPDGSELDTFSESQMNAFRDFGILQNDLVFGEGDYSKLWSPILYGK